MLQTRIGDTALSAAERKRYHRQMILPEVGDAGQGKLKAARIAVFGLGGLGAPCATYLAAAGIGRLALIDHDAVDLSNLHRQVLFTEADVGRAKTEATLARIRALNPEIDAIAVDAKADAGNIRDLVAGNDVVVDCTDNFRARFAINDACAALRIPLVQASILQFEAQLSIWCAPGGPCYRCLYPEAPPAHIAPSCAEAGVIGVLPGILGAHQANEVLKLVLGIGQPMVGRLGVFSLLENRFESFPVAADPDCPACSGKAAAQPPPAAPTDPDEDIAIIDAQDLRRLIGTESLQIVDVRNPEERRRQGAIARDLFIPLPELGASLGKLERDRPVICYCVSGQRSLQAARLLIDSGFTDVRSLRKGIVGWDGPLAIGEEA